MIVVDASVIAPIVLFDERPLPNEIVTEFSANPLAAPAHWTVETGNLLLVAKRRGRIDDLAWDGMFDRLRKLRVTVMPAPDWQGIGDVARTAEEHRLTLYDAAYLHLARLTSARLATLDGALIRAAGNAGVPVLTYA